MTGAADRVRTDRVGRAERPAGRVVNEAFGKPVQQQASTPPGVSTTMPHGRAADHRLGLDDGAVACDVRRIATRRPSERSSRWPARAIGVAVALDDASGKPVTIALCGRMPPATPSKRISAAPAGRLIRRVSLTRHSRSASPIGRPRRLTVGVAIDGDRDPVGPARSDRLRGGGTLRSHRRKRRKGNGSRSAARPAVAAAVAQGGAAMCRDRHLPQRQCVAAGERRRRRQPRALRPISASKATGSARSW